ncbi:hypothetical protein PUN28_020030 [Cardiocondyla obscurior]|uniref:Uncharacterized protein n=1 Tax=Cardiocondyla obscurior TaxID=286306 RepID=A0AAW2E667_9HYME
MRNRDHRNYEMLKISHLELNWSLEVFAIFSKETASNVCAQESGKTKELVIKCMHDSIRVCARVRRSLRKTRQLTGDSDRDEIFHVHVTLYFLSRQRTLVVIVHYYQLNKLIILQTDDFCTHIIVYCNKKKIAELILILKTKKYSSVFKK